MSRKVTFTQTYVNSNLMHKHFYLHGLCNILFHVYVIVKKL